MPYRVSFIDDISNSSPGAIFDYSVDLLFGADIIVTFFSAYEESDGSL